MADYINKIRTTEGDKPVNYEALANKPNSLPNPNKIKFTGSVVAEYDGSSEVTVNIPNGASEEQAAQIQTNTNDISELKGDLVEFTSYSRQYIDTSKSTDGYVWTAWGGNLKKETNTSGYQDHTAYDGIYLKANISYHFTNIYGYYSYLFKMNGEYISNFSKNANINNSNYDYIPTEDCVVYITAQTIYKGIRTFLYVGSNAPSSFVYGVYDKSIKEDVSLPPSTEVEAKIAKCFQESTSSQIISNEQLASLDDCDNNKIYRINCSDLSSAPANSPNNRGILFTIGFNKDGQQTLSQFFYGIDGLLNIRYKWGTSWRPWKILSDRNYADSILQSAKDYADSKSIDFSSVDFGFIERFAVVGDSYASGEIYISDGGSGYIQHDYYNLSWGQIMARKYGNICLNLSSGGLSTRTWLTSKKGLELLNSSEPQQLYMCMLGANDIAIGADYIGSIDDIKDDSSQNADSFYGNYGKIISAIKTKAPNAKIVLMTVAYEWGTLEDNFNNAIKTIANHFSIPCIDVKTDVFYSKTGLYQTGKRWNHPTAPLYAGMASANVRLFNKCVEDNYSYFRDYVG